MSVKVMSPTGMAICSSSTVAMVLIMGLSGSTKVTVCPASVMSAWVATFTPSKYRSSNTTTLLPARAEASRV